MFTKKQPNPPLTRSVFFRLLNRASQPQPAGKPEPGPSKT